MRLALLGASIAFALSWGYGIAALMLAHVLAHMLAPLTTVLH